ncbi:MAG: coenzyme F420-0:L-glutamate ligase [Candidatus Bathyarchaeia archaeon]
MRLIALKTRIIHPGEDLLEAIFEALDKVGLNFFDGDVLAISSKVVATVQGRIVKLEDVTPSDEATELAGMCGLEPNYVEVVLREADKVFGGVYGALLTLKDGLLIPNAGVDQKNAPPGRVVLLPRDPSAYSNGIRMKVYERTGRRVGVIIVDSCVKPLRMGTVGYALASSGLKPVVDLRSEEDLFGRRVRITRHSVADDIASAAHILMGETDGRVAAVLVRDAPIELTERDYSSSMNIYPEECLFMGVLLKCRGLKETEG